MTASKAQPLPPWTATLRLGLCSQFAREPIKFRTTTITAMLRLTKRERLARLGQLCRANADALLESLQFCSLQGIGAFRVNSQILPVKTHPAAGNKPASLVALRRNIERLPKPVRSRLTLENDDKVFTPADLPKEWWGWPLTVEVEAKAKELAVARLLRDLQSIDGSYV